MTVLRVATFNIRTGLAPDGLHMWPLRRRSTLHAIESLNADLIGLQEVLCFQRRWLNRMLPGYGFHGSGRSRFRSGETSPVVARSGSLRIDGTTTRWFGPSPDIPGSRIPGAPLPRIATTCAVSTPAGISLDFTSLHLDHRSEARRSASTAQLLNWLDLSRPQIVVGDFNSRPGTKSLNNLIDGGFRSVLGTDSPGTFHGFTGIAKSGAIDHIFVSEHFTVTNAEVVRFNNSRPLPSDHWPVAADLQLGT